MISIINYIKEALRIDKPILEMATISRVVFDKEHYLVAIHGINAGDRERPHIHIYLVNDKNPFNKFNFEIALDEIICYDELNLIKMIDKKNHIKHKHRDKCSWVGYNRMKDDFEDWLYSESNHPGNFIDNLDAIIWTYNNENGDIDNENVLLEYIIKHGMKVNKKFNKYFNKDERERYKAAFC